MTTYTDLTEDQKAALQAFTDTLRPALGQIARVFAVIQQLENAWAGSVGAVVTALDADTPIGTTTGLAGAQTLTREDLISWMGNLQAAAASFNSAPMQQAYIKAAGLVNTL